MKSLFVALFIIVLLLVVPFACGSPVLVGDKAIKVTISEEGGISANIPDVHISNYYKGARAEIEYLITNDTSQDIEPLIYLRYNVNPENYSRGVGYSPMPRYYTDWIDIPKCGVIEPYSAKSYLVVLQIPENCTEEIPDKWAFKIGVSTSGGFVNNAFATWYRVDMR